MNNSPIQILLTNDDGIQSPGLWAAAEALSCLGYVTVAAPRDQWSGAGRSHPSHTDGRINPQTLNVHGKDWTVYAVGGTPAQTIAYGIMEICPRKPDLVVSGINYGENVGTGTTVSGTVGAALEAAAFGIPAMAISLQTPASYNLSYSKDIDFSASKHFVTIFSQMLLQQRMPEDVDVLKVEVPDNANKDTPWQITRIARNPYYHMVLEKREHWEDPNPIKYQIRYEDEKLDPASDVYVLRESRLVSVTPLSIDLTSRVDMADLDTLLRSQEQRDLKACEPD
jgi:5'-nucleotidase